MKRKLNQLMMIAVAASFMASCSSKDEDPIPDPPPPSNVVTITGPITSSQNWDASKKYLLIGNVFVRSGATLTIPAGTIVMGDKDSKGALIINRGATIKAEGTAANPIVFTSGGPVGFRNRGDWGGIVICGYDPNSNGTSATIEGISGSATSPDGKYGVGGAADGTQDPNAGVDPTNGNTGTIMKYCRIEFAGIALSSNNELNSLTMGSVGPNAEIDYIMVSYAGDDAFEWFGGRNNHKYLISYDCWDDDFDSDRGYSGMVQYGVIIRNPVIADVSGARAFEASSNVATATPHSKCKFANITIIGPTVYAGTPSGASSTTNVSSNFRSAIETNTLTEIEVYNSLVTGFREYGIAYAGLNTANAKFEGIYSFGNVLGTTTGTGPASTDITPVNDSTGYQDAWGVLRGQSNLTSGTLNYTNPVPYLKSGSTYATGAPARAGFEAAAFYGAFGTDGGNWNWTAKWVNFNPINTVY